MKLIRVTTENELGIQIYNDKLWVMTEEEYRAIVDFTTNASSLLHEMSHVIQQGRQIDDLLDQKIDSLYQFTGFPLQPLLKE